MDLQLLHALVEDIVSDYNNPSMHHYACYKEYDRTLQYALRIAGLAAFHTGPIVEIGTEGGLASIAMAISSGARVETWDTRPEAANEATVRAGKLGVKNISFMVGNSKQCRELYVGPPPSLIYIDGDHSFAGALRDLNFMSDIAGEDTVIAVDDYYDLRYEPGKSFGVSNALRVFLEGNPEWYGLTPQPMMFLLTKSKNRP